MSEGWPLFLFWLALMVGFMAAELWAAAIVMMVGAGVLGMRLQMEIRKGSK